MTTFILQLAIMCALCVHIRVWKIPSTRNKWEWAWASRIALVSASDCDCDCEWRLNNFIISFHQNIYLQDKWPGIRMPVPGGSAFTWLQWNNSMVYDDQSVSFGMRNEMDGILPRNDSKSWRRLRLVCVELRKQHSMRKMCQLPQILS